jgi:ribonuclease E
MQKKKKKILIDASHEEECRVAVVSGDILEEFEYESKAKRSVKGDVYLARVSRIEPSLQAAFVDFGGQRDGFLSFGEIHPSYYRIPVEDQKEIINRLSNKDSEIDAESDKEARPKSPPLKKYKIQEVIQRRQLILVQVMRDERGGKGAALTTYLSFPGRYCVLMPNTPKGGGISKKVTNAEVRKRLKTLMADLDVEEGSGLILRTAGVDRKKPEIKRDYEYLKKVWEDVKNLTVSSTAPALVYQEGDLVKKTLRDIYSSDIDEILVEGEETYRAARKLMGKLTPSHVKKIQPYKDSTPLFHKYDIESQVSDIYTPITRLPSGGYLVFGTTEALTSIDVNSGKSTNERHIDETALKTNLEAAEEVAKQLRLRDIGGLVVIDFIDMDQTKYKSQVEQRLENALKLDRARVQMGSISPFGLLEMSRQRLKPSLQESTNNTCPTCQGTGKVPSVETVALKALKSLETAAISRPSSTIPVWMSAKVGLYLLNKKRNYLDIIEKTHKVAFDFKESEDSGLWSFHMDDPVAPKAPPKLARKKQDNKNKSSNLETGPSQEPSSKGTKRDASAKKALPAKPQEDLSQTNKNERKQTSARERTTPPSQKSSGLKPLTQDLSPKQEASSSQLRTTQLKIVPSAQRFGHKKTPPKRSGLLKAASRKPDKVDKKSKAPDIPVIADAPKVQTTPQESAKKGWWRRLIEK